GAESAPARWSAAALVLSDEVPSVRAREKAAAATAWADHAADRRIGVLRSAARARARLMSDDRPAAARRIRAATLVLWIAIGDALLPGRNVSRRERWHSGVSLLRQGRASSDHLQRATRGAVHPRSHSRAGCARRRIELRQPAR